MPFKYYLYLKAVMINIFETAMYHQTVSQRKYERGDESKETNVFPLFTNRCKKQQQQKINYYRIKIPFQERGIL